MELVKFFLDLQCSSKFAFVAAQVTNMALSAGESKQKTKRQLGTRLSAPFITYKKAHVVHIAKNDYASSFATYLRQDISDEII